MFNQNIRSFDNFTFCNLVITCKLFYVKKLMHYLEYKNNIIYNKHFLQSYYSDSNKWLETILKLYTQLQLCKKEWGWIPQPHSLPCMGTMNCDQSWTRKR